MTHRLSVRMRFLAALLGVLLLLLWTAAPATAEVTVDAVLPQGDGSVALVIAVEQGCEDASTTGLTLEVPEGSAVIGATAPDGWDRVLDGRRVEFAGPAIPAGQVAEFILTSRLGAEPGDTVTVSAEQRCAGGATATSTPRFEVAADAVDPRMTVVEPPDVPAGAGTSQIAVAIAGFVVLVVLAALRMGRRSGRR